MESVVHESKVSIIALRAFFFVLAFYVVAAAALMKEATNLHGATPRNTADITLTR